MPPLFRADTMTLDFPMKQLLLASSIVLLFLSVADAGEPGKWMDHYVEAAEQAKAENKLLLLDFTGSDWCRPCMEMEKRVFTQSAFQEYAKEHLILLRVDFPSFRKLPPEVVTQNGKLRQQYKVEGFPAFVLLDADGRKLAQREGAISGGPAAFISFLEKRK